VLDAMKDDPEQFCADAAWHCEQLARRWGWGVSTMWWLYVAWFAFFGGYYLGRWTGRRQGQRREWARLARLRCGGGK
jgi:hypothetical protein